MSPVLSNWGLAQWHRVPCFYHTTRRLMADTIATDLMCAALEFNCKFRFRFTWTTLLLPIFYVVSFSKCCPPAAAPCFDNIQSGLTRFVAASIQVHNLQTIGAITFGHNAQSRVGLYLRWDMVRLGLALGMNVKNKKLPTVRFSALDGPCSTTDQGQGRHHTLHAWVVSCETKRHKIEIWSSSLQPCKQT